MVLKNIWSVKEAAEKMGISTRHLRRLLKQGEVSGGKLGGVWIVVSLERTKK